MLHQGKVTSDQSDLYALYKHSKKLDKLTRKLGIGSFLAAQDFTDIQFNLGHDELPPGMESTDELMAQNGNWIAAPEAVTMLKTLIAHIETERPRFGYFSDDRADVLRELEQSLVLAEQAQRVDGMFNFSVVM